MIGRKANDDPSWKPETWPAVLPLPFLERSLKLIHVGNLARDRVDLALMRFRVEEGCGNRLANVVAGHVPLFGITAKGSHGAQEESPAYAWGRDNFHEPCWPNDRPTEAGGAQIFLKMEFGVEMFDGLRDVSSCNRREDDVLDS